MKVELPPPAVREGSVVELTPQTSVIMLVVHTSSFLTSWSSPWGVEVERFASDVLTCSTFGLSKGRVTTSDLTFVPFFSFLPVCRVILFKSSGVPSTFSGVLSPPVLSLSQKGGQA